MAEQVFTLNNGFALTGSIGVGKSTVVSSLREWGWQVIESDQIARDVVRPGEPGNREIRARFGREVFAKGDELDRAKLASIVFNDAEKRRWLEAILHPKVRARWISEAAEIQKKGQWVAVDIPLLYEVGAQDHFKHVVVVACSASEQDARLRGRRWSEQEIKRRLSAQLPQQEKIDRADFVIWNEATKDDMEDQLKAILKAIQRN